MLKVEFVGWKGKNSLRAYVPKGERIHYLRLLGCDTSKYEKNKFEERRAKGWKRNGDSEREEAQKEAPVAQKLVQLARDPHGMQKLNECFGNWSSLKKIG